MKVTLDLSKLREQGAITQAEYDRLLQLGRQDTGALGINILVGFGVVAVSLGLIALLPNPFVVIALGAVLAGAGVMLILNDVEQWSLLAQICLVVGALMVCGSIVAIGEGELRAIALVTALLTAAALVARSSLLMAAAVLALAACLGARSGYSHASYSLAIYEPVLTIVLFSLLAYGTYEVSKRVTADYQRLAITAARVSVFLVNFGFWIGSLWGDRLTWAMKFMPISVSRTAFVIGWAAALLAIGIWGARANRRWVVNVAAVFGGIHFYTQWFEWLGATPVSILVGGCLMLAAALTLWRFNRATPVPVAAG
jgi:hypothetical protein